MQKKIHSYLIEQLNKYPNFHIKCSTVISEIHNDNKSWQINTNYGVYNTDFIVNATYASLNQIHLKANLKNTLKIKYELCEVVLCKVSDNIKNVGITVMDGPFFSLMPFGLTGYHSLTSVSNTPHLTSNDKLPTFKCQSDLVNCNKENLNNCNFCINKPNSSFFDMYKLAKHYLNNNIEIYKKQSLFTVKALLASSEISDARPTIINIANNNPKFLSVFSGKINTIYDLDEFL